MISRPSLFFLCKARHWGDLALKSPVLTEHARLRSLTFDKNKLRFVQKSSNSSQIHQICKHVKKHFFPNSQLSDQKKPKLSEKKPRKSLNNLVGISADCITFFRAWHVYYSSNSCLWNMLERKIIRILYKLFNSEHAWIVIVFNYWFINRIIQVFSIY